MNIKRTEIEKLIRHLRAALEVLEAQIAPVEVSESIRLEVERKKDEGICLAWEHPIPDGDRGTRGLCDTCYATTMARIRRGEITEAELLQKGELGPPGKSGRKSAREIAIEKAAKQKKVAEDLEAYEKKKAARKKAKSNDSDEGTT